jgi:cytochrome c oxidase cbb3-type subunit 3
MPEFGSAFWGWFIAVPTVAGIIGLILLMRWMDRGATGAPDEPVGTMGHVWDEDLADLNNPLPRWWLNLFYLTLGFGALYLLLYPGLGAFGGLLGWTDTGAYDREMARAERTYGPLFEAYRDRDLRELVNDPGALAVGRRLYAAYCATCHGADARGTHGFPNLRDQEWIWGAAPEAIEHSIAYGRQAVMPPWGAILGEDGVFAVTEYVRSLSGRPVDPEVGREGERLFAQHCTVCHGPGGRGNAQLGASDLGNNSWLYGGTQRRIMESIRDGRTGKMPAHGEFLGEAKVHLLAAYVFGLAVNEPEVAD